MSNTTIKPIKKIVNFDNWDIKHEYGFATKSDKSSIQEIDLAPPVYQENGDTYYTIGDHSNNGASGITDGNYASTLSQVSRDTGLSIEKILELNPEIKDPDMLEIGQKIRVTNNNKESNIEATTNLTQDQYYSDAINLFNELQQQDIKLSESQRESLNKLYDLIKQGQNNTDINVKIDIYLAIDSILEEIYADVEESKRNQIQKEQETLLRDLLSSDNIYDFVKRNNIDVQAMLKEYTTKNPKGIDFGDKRTMWKNSTVSVANILGADGESLLQTLNNCYAGNNDYQTRSIDLLEASSDEILESIKNGKDSIRITQTKDGNYVVAENGNHRISVLRILYLNEVSNATSQAEIDRINQKYNIPVQVLSEDTIVENVESILKDTKYEQVRRDIDGNIVLYGPQKINENGVKYRDSIKISENEAKSLIKNPNMIFTTKIEVPTQLSGFQDIITLFREDTETIEKITKITKELKSIREFLIKKYREEIQYNPSIGNFYAFIGFNQKNNTLLTNIINKYNSLHQEIIKLIDNSQSILTDYKINIINNIVNILDNSFDNVTGIEALKAFIETNYNFYLCNDIRVINLLKQLTPNEIILYLIESGLNVKINNISIDKYSKSLSQAQSSALKYKLSKYRESISLENSLIFNNKIEPIINELVKNGTISNFNDTRLITTNVIDYFIINKATREELRDAISCCAEMLAIDGYDSLKAKSIIGEYTNTRLENLTNTETKDNLEINYTDNYDMNKIKTTLDNLEKLPPFLKELIKRINFYDYYNPYDVYWQEKYGYGTKQFISAATGGDGQINVWHSNSLDLKKLAHEAAHCYDTAYAHLFGNTTRISETPEWINAMKSDEAISGKTGVTQYAIKSGSSVEDFAESIALYTIDKHSLDEFPNRKKIIEELFEYHNNN